MAASCLRSSVPRDRRQAPGTFGILTASGSDRHWISFNGFSRRTLPLLIWLDPDCSAIERGGEIMRRSDPSDMPGGESSPRGRLDPLSPGDVTRNCASTPRGPSVIARDDDPPADAQDLLTDAQLAVRWQLSRGTLAKSAISGPWSGLTQADRPSPLPPLGYRGLRAGRVRVAGASRSHIPR
jgi:hypothetical protein